MRKTRKQMVGKVENYERRALERELRVLRRELRQQWRWERRIQDATTENFAIPA